MEMKEFSRVLSDLFDDDQFDNLVPQEVSLAAMNNKYQQGLTRRCKGQIDLIQSKTNGFVMKQEALHDAFRFNDFNVKNYVARSYLEEPVMKLSHECLLSQFDYHFNIYEIIYFVSCLHPIYRRIFKRESGYGVYPVVRVYPQSIMTIFTLGDLIYLTKRCLQQKRYEKFLCTCPLGVTDDFNECDWDICEDCKGENGVYDLLSLLEDNVDKFLVENKVLLLKNSKMIVYCGDQVFLFDVRTVDDLVVAIMKVLKNEASPVAVNNRGLFFESKKVDLESVGVKVKVVDVLDRHDTTDIKCVPHLQIKVQSVVLDDSENVREFRQMSDDEKKKICVAFPVFPLFKKKIYLLNNGTMLKRDDFPLLSEYVVSPKLDGVRVQVIVMDGSIFLVNRRGEIMKYCSTYITVPCVLDAEFIEEQLVILDVVCFNNVYNGNMTLRERLFLVEKLVLPRGVTVQTFSDTVKDAVTDFPTDGYIFTPKNSGYSCSRWGYKIWKPKGKLTIDVLVRGEEKLFVSIISGSSYINLDCNVPGKFIAYKGRVIEVIFCHVLKTIIFIRLRDDKEEPNSLSVYQGIKVFKDQNITRKELMAISCGQFGRREIALDRWDD